MIGIDLFAGAGGMSLGASSAGVKIKVAVEMRGSKRIKEDHGVRFRIANSWVKFSDKNSLCDGIYSQREIGVHFNLHPSKLNVIVRRDKYSQFGT
jgi:hypothetical protein